MRLAVEATRGVTDVVDAMHRAALIGNPFAAPIRAVSARVYQSVRAVAALVGTAIDLALAPLEPLLGGSVAGREREALRAALNGVLGDYLEATANPLAIP